MKMWRRKRNKSRSTNLKDRKLRIHDLSGNLLMIATVEEWREAVRATRVKRKIHAGTLHTSESSSAP